MKKFSLALLALALALAIAPAALADTFSFQFDANNGFVFAGQLTGTQTANPGQYLITSGTGIVTPTMACCNVTFNINPNAASDPLIPSWLSYDNLLTPGAPLGGILDNNGLIFTDPSNTFYLNVWGNGDGTFDAWLLNDSGGSRIGQPLSGTFYITPEPGSLFLLGTGLLGLAIMLFRKAKPSRLVLNM